MGRQGHKPLLQTLQHLCKGVRMHGWCAAAGYRPLASHHHMSCRCPFVWPMQGVHMSWTKGAKDTAGSSSAQAGYQPQTVCCECSKAQPGLLRTTVDGMPPSISI